jgi:thiol-disulfide isomerase/thioredoxin
MKLRNIACLLTAAWLASQTSVEAQPTNAPTPTVAQFQQVMQQVQAKLSAGSTSEADLADELKGIDALVAGENGAKTDEAASMVFMKARIYLEVFKDYTKAVETMGILATNYPNTPFGQKAQEVLPEIIHAAKAQQIQDNLVAGTVFPDFTTTNLDGGPLSVGALKGKLVLVDFWATWCPPCVGEIPNLIATYQKHHHEGFEIIGVSLDENRSALDSFMKTHDGMTWQEYFDGQHWTNNLAVKYGVTKVPFNLLIGPNGRIIARDLRGPDLEMAVAEALALR